MHSIVDCRLQEQSTADADRSIGCITNVLAGSDLLSEVLAATLQSGLSLGGVSTGLEPEDKGANYTAEYDYHDQEAGSDLLLQRNVAAGL